MCISQREHVLNAHQTTRCRHGGKKTNSQNQQARTLRKIKVFVFAALRVHSQFPRRNLLSDHTQWERYDSVFTSSHLHGDVIQWRAFELLSQQKKSENSTEFPLSSWEWVRERKWIVWMGNKKKEKNERFRYEDDELCNNNPLKLLYFLLFIMQ